MLPVSGALQLNTSEAHTLRPICSLKKAYSRLLRRLQGRQARFRGANLRSLAAACCGNSTHVRKDRAALSTWCHCVIGTHEASALRVQQHAYVTEQPTSRMAPDKWVCSLCPKRQLQHCVTCQSKGGALTRAPCHRGSRFCAPCLLAATDSTSPALVPWPKGDSRHSAPRMHQTLPQTSCSDHSLAVSAGDGLHLGLPAQKYSSSASLHIGASSVASWP